jgi:hypothetical protein
MILPHNSLRAAPAGAASKLSLWLPKNQEVQFGALCLKMREPFLSERADALPRRRSLRSLSSKKVFFAFPNFARAGFSSKRKRKLFCWLLLLTEQAAGLGLGRRAKIFLPSSSPPIFARLIIDLAKFGRGRDFLTLSKKFSTIIVV